MPANVRMGGIDGSCRSVHGKPLFAYMRSTVKCEGSKIYHLLSGGLIRIKFTKIDYFLAVLRRILRDRPMPAKEFRYAVHRLYREYNPAAQSFRNRGMKDFSYITDWIIGDVRLVNGEIEYIENCAIAEARDAEFKKQKYKKMDAHQVNFLMSLFELTELTKQYSRGKK